MGAIDPVVALKQASMKSVSVEDSNRNRTSSTDNANSSLPIRLSITEATIDAPLMFAESPHDYYNNSDTNHSINDSNEETMDSRRSSSQCQRKITRNNNNSFHVKARKLLTLSPSGLKPSASTSCLNLAVSAASQDQDQQGDSSHSLVSIPTRASLTHEWKKLKTPNKCRECNLLVYFNGRECSFCGFIAHKKCVAVLVIKCSGQQVSGSTSAPINYPTSSSVSSTEGNVGTASQKQPKSGFQSQRKSKSSPIQPIFGQPVDTDSRQVADFLRRFIYEIDARGLSSRGIYRVSSIKSKVDRLSNYYDQNLSSLVDLSSFHPNIIANTLKMYLRQLPEPLLTHALYHRFIEVSKKYSSSTTANNQPSTPSDGYTLMQKSGTVKNQRKLYSAPNATSYSSDSIRNPTYDPLLIVELKEIVEQLPPINQELIAILMRHLRRVADKCGDNQMSAKNLSIIFGPTLLSSDNKSLAIVDNIHQARLIELMITWAEQIFPQYINYESKAVIELDVPCDQTQIEAMKKAHQYKSSDKMSSSRRSLGFLDSKQNITDQSRDTLSRKPEQVNCYELDLHKSSTKIRDDLRELRRQFFSAPNTPAKDVSATGGSASRESNDQLSEPKMRPNNPPGSVPVIKVQPNYCNSLTQKYNDNKR